MLPLRYKNVYFIEMEELQSFSLKFLGSVDELLNALGGFLSSDQKLVQYNGNFSRANTPPAPLGYDILQYQPVI